jgi:branched-chain amino acid transport system ATP-binding protein
MYAMFPRLKERQHTEAGVMSGGEQQMLTLCRTLMGDPDLIIIDEPTEGLAPKIVELVGEYLGSSRARRVGAADRAEADHRHEDLGPGAGDGPRRIVFDGTPADLRATNACARSGWRSEAGASGHGRRARSARQRFLCRCPGRPAPDSMPQYVHLH